jgi:hypothetical protein
MLELKHWQQIKHVCSLLQCVHIRKMRYLNDVPIRKETSHHLIQFTVCFTFNPKLQIVQHPWKSSFLTT